MYAPGQRWTVLSGGGGTKTREELLAEIEALSKEIAQRGPDTAKTVAVAASTPVFSIPITRRESLVRWVAPVILSLPVVQVAGMVLGSGTAHAVTDDVGAPLPSFRPTGKPTPKPSVKPSAKPTSPPTRAGRCIVAPTATPPTAAPAASPTLGLGAAPDSRAADAGFVALGSARAVSLGYIGP